WYARQVRQQRLDCALIAAIKKKDTTGAIALLDLGANANATDKPYVSITWKSTLLDFWERMKGKQPPKDTAVYTPALLLPYALDSSSGKGDDVKDNPELVKTLLDHGADPYAMNENGAMILHLATYFDNYSTVRVLLEHHVDPNMICKDQVGNTFAP